jgi:hypothetical protein
VLANQLGLALGLRGRAGRRLNDCWLGGLRLPPELAAASALATAAEAGHQRGRVGAASAGWPTRQTTTAILPATENLITQIAVTVGARTERRADGVASTTIAQQAELAAFAETTAGRP